MCRAADLEHQALLIRLHYCGLRAVEQRIKSGQLGELMGDLPCPSVDLGPNPELAFHPELGLV
jgi:hypothetical protein